MNAWPALNTRLYDGWVLRFAQGYTRRANSVYPLYPATLDVRAKIAACESAYRQLGLRPVFKLTAAAQPPELNALLDERGYEYEAPTSVQVADLTAMNLDEAGSIELIEAVTDEWIAAFCRLSNAQDAHQPVMTAMLRRIRLPHAFAALRRGGAVVACGLVVLEDGWAGLHDIVTHPQHRNQGHARRLVRGLLAWAWARGARTGWLGVLSNNLPAQRLYAGFGFAEQYQYWYRVAQEV